MKGWMMEERMEMMAKRKKTKSLPVKATNDEETYKVRAAITLAHYLFVQAESPDEAERKADEYIRDIEKNHGGYDWYGEASHMHTTFEVEEAE